jgi:hypothetical protein
MKEDDNNWPMPDRVGKQELEIKMNGEHICFNTTKLGSVLQVQQSKDPDGLRIFYYLVQVRAAGVWGGHRGGGRIARGFVCMDGTGAVRVYVAQLHTCQRWCCSCCCCCCCRWLSSGLALAWGA